MNDHVLVAFVLGCAVGYIVSELRDIRRAVDVESKTPPRKITFTNIALALVVIMVAYAAFSAQQAQNGLEENVKADQIARCKGGVETRNVQRETVDAVYNLALGAVVRQNDDPPRTEDQIRRINFYIDRANDFRAKMYKLIKPTDVCREYVNDDRVSPPTPPAAHVTQ